MRWTRLREIRKERLVVRRGARQARMDRWLGLWRTVEKVSSDWSSHQHRRQQELMTARSKSCHKLTKKLTWKIITKISTRHKFLTWSKWPLQRILFHKIIPTATQPLLTNNTIIRFQLDATDRDNFLIATSSLPLRKAKTVLAVHLLKVRN